MTQCSIRTLASRGIALLLAITLAGCASAAPPPTLSPADRWHTELAAYRAQRGKLGAETLEVRENFQALSAEASFPGLEDKIATLAARIGRGEERDEDGALTRSLGGLTLGELLLFQRYLALSSRVVELEATHAELESARLDLLLRRLRLGLGAEPGADVGEAPPLPPFACPRYRVGRLEFVSCR